MTSQLCPSPIKVFFKFELATPLFLLTQPVAPIVLKSKTLKLTNKEQNFICFGPRTLVQGSASYVFLLLQCTVVGLSTRSTPLIISKSLQFRTFWSLTKALFMIRCMLSVGSGYKTLGY